MTGQKAACGFLAAAAAPSLVAVICRLMPYQHRPVLRTVPAFALCENAWGTPCHPSLPTRWLTDFYETLAHHAMRVASSGGRPVVLHVGASTFEEDELEYGPLLQALRQRGLAPRLVLVEPELEHRERLLTVYKRLSMPAGDITVATTAMNKECDGDLTQYLFDDRLYQDFAPENKSVRNSLRLSLRSWRTFEKESLSGAIIELGTQPESSKEVRADAFDWFHNVLIPVIRKIYLAGNWTEYIVEVPVPCAAPPTLLEELGVPPRDLVMVTCDAEGVDVPIMEGFMELPQFQPSLVKWEGRIKNSSMALVHSFQRKSYTIGVTENGGHSYDVVAFRGPAV